MKTQAVQKNEDINSITNGEFVFCKELGKGFIKRDISSLGVTQFEAVCDAIESLPLDSLKTSGLDSVIFFDGNISISDRLEKEIEKYVSELSVNNKNETFIRSYLDDKRTERKYFDNNFSNTIIDNFTSKSSCKEWLDSGATTDGVYTIKPADTEFDVYCDMTTDGGGWNVTWRNEGSLSITQYNELTESIWLQNSTEFLWHIKNLDNTTEAVIKTKFNDSYIDWKNGHIGGNTVGMNSSVNDVPPLNAIWYINIPSIGINYNYNKTGIVRAVPFKDTISKDTQLGLHYKRTDQGEHYPWFDANGNMSYEGYLCSDTSTCGYSYGSLTDKTHILAVR